MIERTKYIPPIIALAGGLIACIATIVNSYSSLEIMLIVLVAIIVFYIAGSIIRMIANKALYIPEPEEEEGSETGEDGEVKESEDGAEGEESVNEDEKIEEEV